MSMPVPTIMVRKSFAQNLQQAISTIDDLSIDDAGFRH